MPHHKSCKKRMRTSLQEQFRNRAARTTLKGSIKDLKACKTPDEASAKYKIAASRVDKAVRSNVIHKNKAARLKSRLAGFVNSLSKSE